MAKNESTAINSLIQVAQGRIADRSEPADDLFRSPPPQYRAPQPAYLPPQITAAPMPAPLPRVRAPKSTPSPQWDDDDAQTRRVDPAVREAVLRNARAYEAAKHAQRAAALQIVGSGRDSVQHLATMRVAALPHPSQPLTFVQELGLIARRYTLQVGGAAVLLAVAVTYLVVGGGTTPSAEAAAPAPAPVVTKRVNNILRPLPEEAVAPVVTPIVEPPAIAVPPPVAVAPTDIAPAEIEPADIEMDAMPATRTASRRRAKRVATVIPAAPKRAAAKVVVADEADPVLAAISKTARAKDQAAAAARGGDGPAKVSITSSVPAMIYVDGRATGAMTPKTLTLAAGKHRITLLEPTSKKAKTSDLDLAAGDITRVDRTF